VKEFTKRLQYVQHLLEEQLCLPDHTLKPL